MQDVHQAPGSVREGLYHNKALPKDFVLREWRLEGVLGVGGFGIVYRGRSLYFDEQVAIKEYFPGAISDRVDDTTVAPNDSSAQETYALGLQKFVEEAKVLWNLSRPERHPNIVSVRSLFEIHGTAYMVMDFEKGVSLSQMIKEGRRFDEATLLGLIRPIADGLDRAHGDGVLHRDIKPANILVDDTGRPVLIDFGSARFESGQATSTKVTFYTPPYAALEQYVKTFPQGPWTDIYALGVTLYECVTGKKPGDVLERLHGGEDEALSERAWPGFSRAFTRAVDAAMAIKPADRPQSIPDWLRLFDEEAPTPSDDATVVAPMLTSLPEPAARAEPTAAQMRREIAETVAQSWSAPPEDPVLAPPQAKGPSKALLVGGGVAVVAGVAVAAVLGSGMLGRKSSAITPVPQAPAPVAAQAVDAAAPVPSVAPPAPETANLSEGLDALASRLRSAGRPVREIAAVNAASRRITSLKAQREALQAQPDAAAKVAPLDASMIRIAFGAAKGEGLALSREASGLLTSLQGSPAWSSGQASLAPVRKAKSALDGAVAAISRAPHPAAAIAATGRALDARQTLATAVAAAQPVLVVSGQEAAKALQLRARQAAAAVVARAAGSKPSLFASKAKKDAFKAAQDAAALAHTRLGDVDRVVQRAMAARELGAVDDALAQLGPMVRELEAMKAPPASPPA